MKYFIDTEFVEGPQREKFPISLFRKETPNTIDLISIGIVAEDGREYYAISKDFNLREAWNRYQIEVQSGQMRNVYPNGKKVYWLRENVLNPIFMEFQILERDYLEKQKRMIGYAPCINSEFSYSNFKRLLKKYGKTNKGIAGDIKEFVYGFGIVGYDTENQKETTNKLIDSFCKKEIIEFYAYYADYDWVVFCWLFGKMIDLPKGFPMYCKDLKQMMDEKALELNVGFRKDFSFKNQLNYLKSNVYFPKQDSSKSHNAIEDARWNKQLFEFLTTI